MPKMPTMPSSRGHSSVSQLRKNEIVGAGLLTAILVVVSLSVFTIGVREGDEGFLHSVRGAFQTLVSPLKLAGASLSSPFVGMSNVMRNLTADEQTLSELKEENKRLLARNVELEEAQITLKQLQELLELRSTYNLQSTAATVIAGSADSWTSTVTLDKGTSAGLVVGMPVVDGKGAIGQIIACELTTSTVRLLSDEGSSVSAMIQSSRAQGMLRGSPDGTLYLSFIRTDQTVDVGEIVVTSGLGGVFPKGLPLGKVSSVESSPGSTYYVIVVEPYSTVMNLEEVLVVTSLTEEQEATAEDIEAADNADLKAASGLKVATNGKEDGDEKDGDVNEDEADGETEDGGKSAEATGEEQEGDTQQDYQTSPEDATSNTSKRDVVGEEGTDGESSDAGSTLTYGTSGGDE